VEHGGRWICGVHHRGIMWGVEIGGHWAIGYEGVAGVEGHRRLVWFRASQVGCRDG